MVEDERRREIGLFRYALIRRLPSSRVCQRLSAAGWSARSPRASIWARTDGSFGLARSTLDDWIRAYRQGGFEALVPKPRLVAPRTPAGVLELAFQLKRERPERTAAQVHQIMLAAGVSVHQRSARCRPISPGRG